MKKFLLSTLMLVLVCVENTSSQVEVHHNLPYVNITDSTPTTISLNGECAFAADYADNGEYHEWFSPDYKDDIWDRVQIPHVWSLDPRYPYYEGVGWYRKTFTVPTDLKTKHVRLVFEAVYARSIVWLNGKQVKTHDGGYTPFEVDVTSHLNFGKPNLLVVKADNRIKRKANSVPQLVKAWMEDGGIIRDVYLEATADVYITKQKINAEPNLQTGEAIIRILTWVRNTRTESVAVRLQGMFSREKQPLNVQYPKLEMDIPPRSTKMVRWLVKLPREMVHLWSLERPALYSLTTSIKGGGSTNPVSFGIRKFEVMGNKLLLNGFPVRLGGANRVASGTGFGQNDPVEFVETDLRLMKEAGLEFMRMHHVPLSKAVLDWADENGMLLIEECDTPSDIFSESANASDRLRVREMIERDWNRPSVVAWSIGNEYESETPEGLEWSKMMKEFVLSIDSTRLVCFASNRAAKQGVKPEEEASSIMDMVCLNTYGATPADNAANIDIVRQRWPKKPLIITEYGYRADRVGQEKDRELWFKEMLQVIRDRPFVSGASLWSFNDYRSRYVSTNPDGYRWWGLVDASRNLRGSYFLFKQELTPIILEEAYLVDNNLVIRLVGRSGFPIYPPTACDLNIRLFNFRGREIDVLFKTIKPVASGDNIELKFPIGENVSYFRGEILRGDFSMLVFGPTTWSKKK